MNFRPYIVFYVYFILGTLIQHAEGVLIPLLIGAICAWTCGDFITWAAKK